MSSLCSWLRNYAKGQEEKKQSPELLELSPMSSEQSRTTKMKLESIYIRMTTAALRYHGVSAN
jgi:hypothetical protein